MPLVFCKQCGAKVNDESGFCPYCKAPIEGGPPKSETHIGEEFCPNCNAKTTRTQKFCPICGHALAIDAEEVLNASLRIVRKAPLIVLPTVIFSILSTIFTVWFEMSLLESTSASPSTFFATLWNILPLLAVGIMFGILASPVVNGMYPSMVRDAYEGRTLDMPSAFRKTMKRYPSILAANLVVGILTLLASLLFIIPGIIVGIWYAYTVPAIILENRGALDGMSSSKKFARNKKWGTLLILAIPTGVSFMGSLVQNGISHFAGNGASVAGIVRVEILGGTELVFGAISGILLSIMLPYTYLFYAMRRTTEQQQSST